MGYDEFARLTATPFDRALDRAIADENENPRGLPPDILAGMEESLRKTIPTFFSPFYLDIRACAETNS